MRRVLLGGLPAGAALLVRARAGAAAVGVTAGAEQGPLGSEARP